MSGAVAASLPLGVHGSADEWRGLPSPSSHSDINVWGFIKSTWMSVSGVPPDRAHPWSFGFPDTSDWSRGTSLAVLGSALRASQV